MFKKFSIIRQSAAKLRFKRSEKVQRIGIETTIVEYNIPKSARHTICMKIYADLYRDIQKQG